MIKPPYDLDSGFEKKLEIFRQECMELTYKAVVAAREAGVPQEALWAWTPDPDKDVSWRSLPDVYADYIEFTGEVWRHQDTDYVSFKVDRRLMDRKLYIEDWAAMQKAAYDVEQERVAQAQAQTRLYKEDEARKKRQAQYEELKKEFGD